MSDLMLLGKLNMPLPNDPQDCDVVTWVQFKAAAKEASDRIEELEAKLAKAVGLIQFLDKEYQHVWGVTAKSKIRTTLAELKGEDR